MNKYRLVIFGDTWDVYQVAHKEWIDSPSIVYLSTFRPKGLLGVFQKVQFNPQINAVFPLPGKSLWNAYYLRGVKDTKVCFLITERWLRIECGIRLLPFLRSHYPQSRIVCFTQDILATIKDLYSGKAVDVDYIKKYTDLFISYDKNDAKKYHIHYHPTVFSALAMDGSHAAIKYDLYFLGRDKGRLPLLMTICKEAAKRGLKCKMILTDVPQSERIACEGITYSDANIPYRDNLRYCASSKCVLEVLQHAATSPTFRTWESIMLNRKLMTNSDSIKESEVYDSQYISVFHDITDFDWAFIGRGNDFRQGNPYQELIKPDSLVRFIESQLHITIERS